MNFAKLIFQLLSEGYSNPSHFSFMKLDIYPFMLDFVTQFTKLDDSHSEKTGIHF